MSLQDSKKLETVKILMLKGEKGEQGAGSYDDTEVRGLITAEAQERATDINTLEMVKADQSALEVEKARIDSLITNGQTVVTTLWSGTMSSEGGTYALSESVVNFDFIDIYFENKSTHFLRIPADKSVVNAFIPYFDQTASPAGAEIGKIKLTFSGASVTLTAPKEWFWNGQVTGTNAENPAFVDAQVSIPVRIDGVKLSSISPSELQDVRLGANGVTYASAGDAVRGQISAITTGLKKDLGIIDFFSKLTATTILFELGDVSIGDTITYSMDVQAPTAYIETLDSNDTRIAYYGKGSSSQPMGTYSGSFVIPSNFAKARLVLNNGGYAIINTLTKNTSVPEVVKSNSADIQTITDEIDSIWKSQGYLYYEKNCVADYQLLSSTDVEVGDLLEYAITPSGTVGYIELLDSNNTRIAYYGKGSSALPAGTYSGIIEIPDGFNKALVRGNASSKVTLSAITQSKELSILTGERIKIKDRTELFENKYSYFAFSSGIMFQGMEIHATRVGYHHYPTGQQTAIQFLIVDENGKMRTTYPDIDYTSLGETDLRDPNLSTTRDGQYLLMSVFGEVQNGQNYDITKSYIIVFDSDLEIVATFDMGTTLLACWGNTLMTEDGYLLKCVYDKNGDVNIYKSNEVFNTTSMTFSSIKQFDHETIGYHMYEPTIGYVGDKLVCIIRTSDANSALICWSTENDGNGGWTEMKLLGFDVHSPVMQLFTKGDVFVFGGSLWLGNYRRTPCIGKYDLTNESCQAIAIDSFATSGGYPSMINLGGDNYAMVYYEDYNNTSVYTYGYYRRVNINRHLLSQYS